MQPSTIPAVTILPLRMFLGLTFLYAAYQKIADPGFLRAGSSTYIGAQTHGIAHGSPIGFFLRTFLEPHPLFTGFSIIATEWAVGVLVVIGLFSRLAALVGLMTNLGLFLSASWNVYPYFLGSDIVFVMAWGTLFLAGPGPFALDSLSRYRADPSNGTGFGPTATVPGSAHSGQQHGLLSRYETVIAGVGAIALVVLGLLPRSRGGGTSPGAVAPTTSGPTPRTTSKPGGAIPPGAKKAGTVRQIPVNSAADVTDPKSGDPAVIIHLANLQFVAYDATCTHAGCTVAYDSQSRLLSCPCHGAQYDPARAAAVVAGPAPSPLTSLRMVVDGNGDIYLV